MCAALVPAHDRNMDLGPSLLRDLVPAAERTALLFEISHLCLGKFPELKRIIRVNAMEVQMAFNSSNKLLMQCVTTSKDMVEILIPAMMSGAEMRDPTMTLFCLEIAGSWIQDTIKEVEHVANQYGNLSRDVSSAASEVYATKQQTNEIKKKLSQESQDLQKKVDHLNSVVREKQAKLVQQDKAIELAEDELQGIISDIANRNRKFRIVAIVVPLFGFLIDAAQRSINSGEDTRRMEMAKNKLRNLGARRSELSRDLGQSQTELLHWQFQLTKEIMELGIVPDPVHLPEVQQNLTQIQQMLLQLRNFWERIEKLVKDLKQKTFSGKEMVDCLDDYKEEFLESLNIAKQAWMSFQCGCEKVSDKLTQTNRDAYNFLETNPSALTPWEWQRRYDTLKACLENLYQECSAIEDQ